MTSRRDFLSPLGGIGCLVAGPVAAWAAPLHLPRKHLESSQPSSHIPVVSNSASRDEEFAAPELYQRVHNLHERTIELWNGSRWVPGLGGTTTDVRSFGAVGNGRVDDTKAIQDTIDAALNSNGVVFIAPGQYQITQTLIVDSLKPLLMVGTGDASQILMNGNDVAIRLRKSAHVIQSLRFLSAPSQVRGAGVIIERDASYAQVLDCVFESTPASGVVISRGNKGACILRNRMTSVGHGREVLAPFTSAIRAANVTDVEISDNVVEDGPFRGIDLGVDGGGNQGVVIHGNVVRGFGYIGIGVASSIDTHIISNHISDCIDNAIDVNALSDLPYRSCVIARNTCRRSKDGVFCGHGATQVLISGNVLEQNDRGVRILDGAQDVIVADNVIGSTRAGPGLEVRAEGGSGRRSSHVLLSNNIVTKSATSGIHINAADFVRVIGNSVRESGEHGILCEAATETDIDRNLIADAGRTAVGQYDGIHVDTHSVGFDVRANRISGTTRYVATVRGRHGLVSDNLWTRSGRAGDIEGAVGSTRVSDNYRRGG